MRVTAFAPYPPEGPSTRFRLTQLAAPLSERGLDLRVLPFVTADLYPLLRRRGAVRKVSLLVGGLGRRAREIAAVSPDGVALVHRELAPLLNRALLRRLRGTGAPLVFDFDDAVYLPSPGAHPLLGPLRHPEAVTRAFCRAAAAVMAGNEHLAAWAREARGGGPGVHVVPTVVDTDRFRPRPADERAPGPPRVGWVGSHTSLPYLEALDPVLEDLRAHRRFDLVVVANRAPRMRAEHTFVPWTPEGEVDQVRGLDVGLYPLPDDPWARGKCGFKAIQYMACGVPVVASPVGVLRDLVSPGETGFLADGPGAWKEGVARLLDDAAGRRAMGARGRERVVRSYSLASQVDAVAGILSQARETGGRR
ncbi:MAG: glycosyltransferase family 4 protein [Gemmatimonadetes bacterium]|nr:glycosyltransferase family 4 protein [Gemmatimonadota bacterium]